MSLLNQSRRRSKETPAIVSVREEHSQVSRVITLVCIARGGAFDIFTHPAATALTEEGDDGSVYCELGGER
jgi:hypothetical protein